MSADQAIRETAREMFDISWALQAANEAIRDIQNSMTRPSVLFRPQLSLDGDKWCALYGENLQDGVAGFGETPEKAMLDFDQQWFFNGRHTRRAG